MHGGVKVYRGNPAAARNYVEADHARVDDYYLAEGTGLAERFVATPDEVKAVGPLDGDGYEAWVGGYDPATGAPRGRVRTDAAAVRFVEVVVNGPKTWSLAAALDQGIAEAYDAAQDRASQQIIGYQYDQINRELTWLTFSVDLPAWRTSLAPLVDQARAALDADTG